MKRDYHEAGTARVRQQWGAFQRVFTSRVAYAEVHAALAMKYREGGFSALAFRTTALAFDAEWPSYDQVLVDGTTLAHVRRLVRRHFLRGYDALHLSAAIWLREQIGPTLEFWVADARLAAAAPRERLTVVNPESDRSRG